MKRYIVSYMNDVQRFIDEELEKTDKSSLISYIDEYDKKLGFFMHERLIHLIVTVLFAILEIITLVALIYRANLMLLMLTFLFFILLVPYVMHYYFLENSVQKMYKLRDKIVIRTKVK